MLGTNEEDVVIIEQNIRSLMNRLEADGLKGCLNIGVAIWRGVNREGCRILEFNYIFTPSIIVLCNEQASDHDHQEKMKTKMVR